METWFNHSFLHRLLPERCGARPRRGSREEERLAPLKSSGGVTPSFVECAGQRHVTARPMVRVGERSTTGRTVWEERLVRLRRGKARGLDSVMGVGESAWELH